MGAPHCATSIRLPERGLGNNDEIRVIVIPSTREPIALRIVLFIFAPARNDQTGYASYLSPNPDSDLVPFDRCSKNYKKTTSVLNLFSHR
jgi:hypothetical protein